MSNSKYFFIDAKASKPTPDKSIWQHTSLNVNAGDTVTITCSGLASPLFSKDSNTPNIETAAGIDTKNPNSLDPSLKATSVIAKIGNGPAVEIGVSSSITATETGTLDLAYNDSITSDNAGGYFAKIDINN